MLISLGLELLYMVPLSSSQRNMPLTLFPSLTKKSLSFSVIHENCIIYTISLMLRDFELYSVFWLWFSKTFYLKMLQGNGGKPTQRQLSTKQPKQAEHQISLMPTQSMVFQVPCITALQKVQQLLWFPFGIIMIISILNK